MQHCPACRLCRRTMRSTGAADAVRWPRGGHHPVLHRAGSFVLAQAAALLLTPPAAHPFPARPPVQPEPKCRCHPGPSRPDPLVVALKSGKPTAEVKEVLTAEQLVLPADVQRLVAPAPLRLGPTARVLLGLQVRSPVATALTDTRPRFTWVPVSGVTHYTIRIVDRTQGRGLPVIGRLTGAGWTPSEPLAAGRDYEWEVRAYRDNELLGTAPSPKHRAARFRILAPAAVRKLEASLEKNAGMPLTRAVLYARAGLFDAAEQEVRALQARYRGSSLADHLLEALRATRTGQPGPLPPSRSPLPSRRPHSRRPGARVDDL